MKKFFVLCLTGVIMLAALTGCGKQEVDEVQQDLIQYVETDLAGIKNEEALAINRYNEVSAQISSMKRKDILSAFNDEIIPNYTTFYNNLMNVAPKTAEVIALKQTYVDGVKLQLEGLTALSTAIQENNSDNAVAANDTIAQGKAKVDQHRADIVALAGEHNINIKTDAGVSANNGGASADATEAATETEPAE
ncbi:MAG: hypothetical protein J6D02_07740 [Lachnospira sp.]|nr:hypothetical protein [Lachnospira sp.]